MRAERKKFIVGIEEESPTVNLTPLIDVVFVILIMFILIAPVLEVGKVDLADAHLSAQDVVLLEKEDSPILLHVEKDDSIFINKVRMRGKDELLITLKEAHARFPKAKPLVFHDRRATFGTYQYVKNSLETAGFIEMDVVLRGCP